MRVVYSADHLLHDPGELAVLGRPAPMDEVPERVEGIRRALDSDGGHSFVEPTDHGTGPIEAVHASALVAYLERAWRERPTVSQTQVVIPDSWPHPGLRDGIGPWRPPAAAWAQPGYWCFDTFTPIVEGTYAAARASADVALTALDFVLSGESAAYGLCRPPGHHAARAVFGGFCFFNNAAIVAQEAVRRTGERVAVLDVDYHHGNGTQQIFYDRADVLFVSLHGDPMRAFPWHTGFADERGTGAGAGTNLNVPLAAGCDDEAYLAAFQRGLEAIAAFGPLLTVVSLGFDTYEHDPIGDLVLTTPGYEATGRLVASLGHDLVILQEGGYFLPDLGRNAVAWLRGVEGGFGAKSPSRGRSGTARQAADQGF